MGKFGVLYSKTAPSEHPTIRDIAWAAGIFEGEGHTITKRNRGKLEYGVTTVTQKDRWILDRLRALFGGSVYTYKAKHHDGRPLDYEMSYWKISGARGRGFLQTIYVLLSPRRQAQVRKAMYA